ncbi:MAG: ATP-binding protein [Hyphomonadaceae bacterium]
MAKFGRAWKRPGCPGFPGGEGADYIGAARQFNDPKRPFRRMDEPTLARIAAALERLAPEPKPADLSGADCFQWSAMGLAPAHAPRRVPLDLLLEVDAQKEKLLANTRRFAAGAPANNALLWGVRGAGKSALVKAVHAAVVGEGATLKLVEAATQDLDRIGTLLAALDAQDAPAILFLDDLSFHGDEAALKTLKPALDGGLARGGRVIVYATSNRRHLVERDARENSDDLLWKDTAEEHLALADRFGLWLGFHAIDQAAYLRIVRAYAKRFALPIADGELEREALLWSRTRAARSGRTAWQFIVDLAGRLEKDVAF